MSSLLLDLRFAWRQLQKTRTYALTVFITVALSIGSTSTVFSFVDGLLLKPLPYYKSQELVIIWEHVRSLEKEFPYAGPNPRHALIWRDSHNGLSELVLFRIGATGVSLLGEHPEFVGRVISEPGLLRTLGVQPQLGRDFLPGEGVNGRDDKAIITWALWQTLFEGRANVIGQTMRMGQRPVEVIGVMPKGFYFPGADELTTLRSPQRAPRVEIFSPTTLRPDMFDWNGGYGNFLALGRLQPRQSSAYVQSRLNILSDQIVSQAPAGVFGGGTTGMLSTIVQPFKDAIVGNRALHCGFFWLQC